MPRKANPSIQARNEKIVKMGDVKAAAEKFNLSEPSVYRIIADAGRSAGRSENFDTTVSSKIHGEEVTGPSSFGAAVTRSLFEDVGMTGLRRFGGIIDEEYDKVFKSLTRRLALYREMADDPIVGAVLQAIKMTIRRVNWYVDPVDEENPVNVKAAEFLEQCRDDMSISWTDVIENVLTMIRDGFSAAEVVYKKRMGDHPAKIKQTDPYNKTVEEVDGATSKYDDGRIGWRKWIFMSAQSLTPGTPWIFDVRGGLQAINQMPAPTFVQRSIPIDKAILFRTTAERNNPEGYSLFRPMYQAWYMKKNLEEIEAISAERMGSGYPVFYAGEDVSKSVADPNSDINALIKAGRNIRVDEQMALIIPFKKMGTGALNDNGVLFELVSPPGKGVVDFHLTISRYEQRMAMVGLAQFIHLGMGQVGGSRALGQTFTDFFTMSLEGWLDSIEETIHRYGTERLFQLNHFPGLTALPRITHKGVDTTSLQELGGYLSQLVGVNLITPDRDLEGQLRELADLPPQMPVEVVPTGTKPEVQTGGAAGAPTPSEPTAGQPVSQEKKMGSASGFHADAFAAERGAHTPGRNSQKVSAVNDYQDGLGATYGEWSDQLAKDLAAAADDAQRTTILDDAIGLLLVSLRDLGRSQLTAAWQLALGDQAPTPDMVGALQDAINENDTYLGTSLIPDLLAKLRNGLKDPDILAALAMGAAAYADAIGGLLDTLNARVESYAGSFWALLMVIAGQVAQANGQAIYWKRDALAQHCETCLEFGGQMYDSMDDLLAKTGGVTPANGTDCGANCRCELVGQ